MNTEFTPPVKVAKEENFFKEILKASLIALIVVVPIRFFIAQPFIVSGASMSPTFESSHYLVVDQLSFQFGTPHRGDVVVFKFPNDPSKFFIKRVIGLPGEEISSQNGNISITNSDFAGGFELDEPYVIPENKTSDTFRVELANNEYFVLGDNRSKSSDSRMWGPLHEDLIVGRAFLRILPISLSGILPGDFSDQITF